jgi:hypothetical protein
MTVEETIVASKIDECPYEPGIYEQMDDFDVPDEALGNKIGVYSDSKLIQSALEGILSMQKVREEFVHKFKDGVQIDKMSRLL